MAEEIMIPSEMKALGELLPTLDLSVISSKDFNIEYNRLANTLAQLDEFKKKVDAEIKRVMEEQYNTTGDTSLISGDRKYTYIPPTTRVGIDSKKLQEERPDIYAQYAKVSQVAATLKSMVKKGE